MHFRPPFLALTAMAVVGCAPVAQAQEPPPELTWMILHEINGANFNRAEPLNHPPFVTEVPEGMITAVDVSHDGQLDWLISYESQGMHWCGTGGCLQSLYVSHEGELVLAFDQQALEAVTVSQLEGETRVTAWVHHGLCAPDNWECRYSFAWDPATLKLVERSNTSVEDPGEGRLTPLPPPEIN